MSMSDLEVGEL